MTREEKIEYLAKAVMTLGELGDNKTAYALNEIRLELKGQTELPEGLEEAARFGGMDYVDNIPDGGTDKHPWNDHDVEKAYYDGMLAGAEYQRKQDQSLIELAEDHAMLAGMNKMKEQMMEKAVEADVNTYEDIGARASWAEFVVKMPTKNLGDKVKIIVIPEEKVK